MEKNESLEYSNTEKNRTTKKHTWILYLVLLISIFISTLSGVCAKFAASQPIFSFKFFLYYGLEILILGIYAIIWQQVIKRLNLAIAYSFKASALIWTLVWGLIIFNETINATKIIGVAIVIVGIIIVNIKKK